MTDPTQAEPVQVESSMEETPITSNPSEDIKEDEAPAEKQSDENHEAAETPESQESEEEKLVSQKAVQKRINKLTYEKKEYERQMQAMQEQLNRLSEAQGPKPPKEPIENDFDSYAEFEQARSKYLRDLGRFEAEKEIQDRLTKEKQEQQQRQQQEYLTKAQTEFESRADKFKAETPDFEPVMNDVAEAFKAYDNQTVQAIRQATLEMENAPALLYHLGSNPEQLNEVLGGSPVQALIKLGQIENSLSGAPKPNPKPVNHKPLKTAAGGGQKSLNQMTPDELVGWLQT
jgi:hypothetical protein